MSPGARHTAPIGVALMALVSMLAAGCAAGEYAGEQSYPGVVQAPDLSLEQMSTIRQDHLESLATVLALDPPPDAELVRYVSAEEWSSAQISCVAELGFTIEATADGEGISALSVPPELKPQLNIAMYICAAQYSIDPRSSVPLNESQLRFLHWYYSVPFTACIRGEGLDAPLPPSETTFIESFSESPWNPYSELLTQGVNEATVVSLMARCPQLPPSDEIWPASR